MGKKVDLIKKYKLEEAVKRIQQINEYTFYNSTMAEDDQDPNNNQMGGQNDMGGGMPPMGGDPNGMGGGMSQGGQDDMGGGMPPMGGDPNGMDGGMSQDDQDNMDGDMPPIGDEPNGMGDDDDDNNDEFDDVEMDTEQSDDEVIDVDELTQSQETTEFKVDNVDDKLNKVLKVISKFTDAIEANDKKIEDLKKEFEKRNPTAEETLNLRSLASYPFSERPDEYWKKQQEDHPNYRVISDNDVPTADEQEMFEIHKDDIDNFNEREIMKSLDEEHIKLTDFLSF